MTGERLREHEVTLNGRHVVLRPLTESDWDVLLRWNSDPEVLWYSEGDDVKAYPLADVQGIYREVSRTAFCFIIELADRPIGECWLQEMNLDRIRELHPDRDCRRIDIVIGEKDLWGRGRGTDAIATLTRFGFEEEGADLIYGCGISDFNVRSRRAFERAGYSIAQWIENPKGAKAARNCDLMISREEYESAHGDGGSESQSEVL